MNSEEKKANRERSVFIEFLKASELPVDTASVESRRPPEPDILCSHREEGKIAFELAEICSPEIPRTVATMDETGVAYIRTADTSLYIVSQKLKKRYSTEHPIALLCYTAGRSNTPDDVILPTIRPALVANQGQFRRVHLLGDAYHLVWPL